MISHHHPHHPHHPHRCRLLRWLPLPIALFAVPGLAGCAYADGMNFVADQRVKILRPRTGDEVALPLTLRLRNELGPDQRLAVFVGTQPPGNGESLEAVIPEKDPCHREHSCLDPGGLAGQDIFVGTGTSIVVPTAPAARGGGLTLTVVPIDAAGRRQSESYWYVTVKLAVLK